MKKYSWVILCLLIASCAPKKNPAAVPVSLSDPKAVELAGQMMNAMGGRNAFDAAHYLRFDFAVVVDGKEVSRHSHLWDKFTGRYRVQGKTKEGKAYIVLFDDINKKSGKALVDGKPLADKELQDRLTSGYRRFINDTYWLMMPWKVLDPGVILSYEGLKKDSASGKNYETVSLRFEHVGLTPGDQYWALIDPQTKLMEKWKFLLQGEDHERGEFNWKNWTSYGALKFSTEKTSVDGKETIRTERIAFPESVQDAVFTDPAALIP